MTRSKKVVPKNTLGKAVNFNTGTDYPATSVTGEWPIDNNLAENAIRPFVIGRKAWLFSLVTANVERLPVLTHTD